MPLKSPVITVVDSLRCVFPSSPASSRRTYLSLWVVEPPGTPVISVAGRRVTGGVLEPLQEGDTLALSCTVKGGVPPPSLTWIRDGQVSVVQFSSPTQCFGERPNENSFKG